MFISFITGNTCWINGKQYAVGTNDIEKGDGCNTCTCEHGGCYWCTEKICDQGMYINTPGKHKFICIHLPGVKTP